MGIRARAGIHVGDVIQEGGALRGIAVHIAARVMAGAKGGELPVTETAKDIMVCGQVRFEDRGIHELKGDRAASSAVRGPLTSGRREWEEPRFALSRPVYRSGRRSAQ